MTSALLEFQHVTKQFGGVTAVNDNTFQIKKGDIVALIGPNGAGKTSTFNCITGMYAPDSGEVLFEGKRISTLKPHEIAELGIARTFQNLQIFTNMTILENVMVSVKNVRKISSLGAMIRLPSIRYNEEKAKATAMEKLHMVGLADKVDQQAKDLSFGEQRLLEVARALALEPSILLLDEPMSGLSGEETNEMIELIRRVNKEGTTIFLIEHDLSAVMKISKHIIVLNFGSKIAEGPPEEIKTNEKVIEAYLGREVKQSYKERDIPETAGTGLSIEDLHVYRGSIYALKGVNCSVRQGELAAIIGANGAGKTTLLSTIAGQIAPKQGTIIFNDKDITGLSAEKLAFDRISLVPERRGMFPELTVEESLQLGAYNRYKPFHVSSKLKKEIREEMEKMYEFFPRLKERRKQLSGTLSGGEQQMLAIARGLMAHPKLLMLDEPSLGLAPLIVEEIFEKLYELKQQNITILLVEQNAKAALQVADWVYVLETGTIKTNNKPSELAKDSSVYEAYLSK